MLVWAEYGCMRNSLEEKTSAALEGMAEGCPHPNRVWNTLWVLWCVCVCVLVPKSCPTLCDSMDCSQPASSVHGCSPGKNTGVGYHALLQVGSLIKSHEQGLGKQKLTLENKEFPSNSLTEVTLGLYTGQNP